MQNQQSNTIQTTHNHDIIALVFVNTNAIVVKYITLNDIILTIYIKFKMHYFIINFIFKTPYTLCLIKINT